MFFHSTPTTLNRMMGKFTKIVSFTNSHFDVRKIWIALQISLSNLLIFTNLLSKRSPSLTNLYLLDVSSHFLPNVLKQEVTPQHTLFYSLFNTSYKVLKTSTNILTLLLGKLSTLNLWK